MRGIPRLPVFWYDYPNHSLEILKTLTEIKEVLYLPEISSTKILRLFNTTFLHKLLIKRQFENNFKVLTKRKLFGVHYHYLMTHIREQYQIESDRSTNSERYICLIYCYKMTQTKKLITILITLFLIF